MKNITLYLWWSLGRDGDGYETDYELSEEECEILAGLVNKCLEEKCSGKEDYFDEKEFIDEYLSKGAPQLYERLSEDTTREFMDSMIENEGEWFDEEAEGCTFEEYIEENYCWGFWITTDSLRAIRSV